MEVSATGGGPGQRKRRRDGVPAHRPDKIFADPGLTLRCTCPSCLLLIGAGCGGEAMTSRDMRHHGTCGGNRHAVAELRGVYGHDADGTASGGRGRLRHALRLAGKADRGGRCWRAGGTPSLSAPGATMPATVLRRTRLPALVPHQATFRAVGLDPPPSTSSRRSRPGPAPHAGPATELLTAGAACYHLSPAQEGAALDGPLFYLTTVNHLLPGARQSKCRCAASGRSPLREIVCLGTTAERRSSLYRRPRRPSGLICELAGFWPCRSRRPTRSSSPRRNPALLLQKLSPVQERGVYGGTLANFSGR